MSNLKAGMHCILLFCHQDFLFPPPPSPSPPSSSPGKVSPLVGGRTSYEAERSYQRFSDSFHFDEEDSGAPFGQVVCFNDEESTRDTPNKENLETANQSLSRKRLMASPNLSPIFARRRKCDFDDSSDVPMDEGIRARLFDKNDSNQ
nr:hypothetical transcript [Hymenolepis microstoma]